MNKLDSVEIERARLVQIIKDKYEQKEIDKKKILQEKKKR